MIDGQYRLVEVGSSNPDAVTVGIETAPDGTAKAAVWWESKGDVDADEVEFTNVAEAMDAAEASRALHGFSEVVVVLARPDLWDQQWGALKPLTAEEPMGDISAVDLSPDEAYDLAAAVEAERDA